MTAKCNEEKVLATMARVELAALNDQWDQRTWCGSAQCFAGWACHMDGWEPSMTLDGRYTQFVRKAVEVNGKTVGVSIRHVRELARDILGLNEDNAFKMFNEMNSLEALRQGVDALVAGHDLHDQEDDIEY